MYIYTINNNNLKHKLSLQNLHLFNIIIQEI